jgi:hypothetical protein
LISDVQRCTAPQKSMQIPNVSRSLALVGFEHARNIGPTPIDNQAGALSERFCMMFKNLDGQQVEELLESIWQRGRMQKILAATDPNLLERTRQLKRDSLRLTSLKTERSNPDQVEPSTSLISFDVPDTSEPRLPDPMILEQKSRTGTATGTILPPGFPKIPTLKGKSPTDQK